MKVINFIYIKKMMSRNKILHYNEHLKQRARELRKNSTSSEILLWKYIRKKQINNLEFHRQIPIDNFIVDFYCHEIMCAIEIDGSSHDNKEEYDKERQLKLESMGVKFIRFNHSDVIKNIEGVVETILDFTSPLIE